MVRKFPELDHSAIKCNVNGVFLLKETQRANAEKIKITEIF